MRQNQTSTNFLGTFRRLTPAAVFKWLQERRQALGTSKTQSPDGRISLLEDDHQHLAHDGAAHDRPVASGRPMHVQITLNSRVGDRLRAEARDRNVEPQSLIETMMGIVADDNLFAAIMDK